MRFTTKHIQTLKEGSISRLADTAYALRFLRLLTMPWEKTEAFKQGIIDKNGMRTMFRPQVGTGPAKMLGDPKPTPLDTPKKKSAYTVFHKLVFNLRRILAKIPFGKTVVARYGAALYLIKEHTNMSEKQLRKIMDKVETEFDWDNLPLQESTWFQSIDGKLNPGSYTLVQDIASPLTGELIAKANSRVKVQEQIEPHDTFLGMSIYKVKHQTGQDIYITNGDIIR